VRRVGVACVGMTQSKGMCRWLVLLIGILPGGAAAQAQGGPPAVQEPQNYKIYTERPRIFLRPQRLRLLRRERERQSLRWQQFELLMAGRAPMPEPGFANALYYQTSGNAAYGKLAIAWALTPAATDLRQLALVFDWCQDLLTEAQIKTLAAKLTRGIDATERSAKVTDIRDRTLAAAALADQAPDASAKVMEQTVRRWWEESVVPALKVGRRVIQREDAPAVYDVMHVVRDNLNNDMRDSVPHFFKTFPIEHLISHYPAIYPAPEGEYRIPAALHMKEPDLHAAALSRAAELSMVAFDSNAPESQVLQGWLMDDHFVMRGPFGISYEFLWANPYQPGLSYFHVPLIFRDELFGRLFIRSAWDESASWLGVFEGETQLFQDGKVTVLNPQISAGPFPLTEALVYFGSGSMKFKVKLEEEEAVFILGLTPKQKYDVELDDREMFEAIADAGGIIQLPVPRKMELGVRVRAVPPPRM
jgi:hypothetical protein